MTCCNRTLDMIRRFSSLVHRPQSTTLCISTGPVRSVRRSPFLRHHRVSIIKIATETSIQLWKPGQTVHQTIHYSFLLFPDLGWQNSLNGMNLHNFTIKLNIMEKFRDDLFSSSRLLNSYLSKEVNRVRIWLWKFHLTKDAILRNSKIVVGIWADKWFDGDNEILILSTYQRIFRSWWRIFELFLTLNWYGYQQNSLD